MSEPQTDEEFETPTMAQVLRAVPLLQWRLCEACQHVGLYRDNMRPMRHCQKCGSKDTHGMLIENKLLHAKWRKT